MLTIEVQFFGPAQDAAGAPSSRLTLDDGATLATLIDRLYAEYPQLAAGRNSLRFAVNRAFADPSRPLADGDEVAVIPPVSGGTGDTELIALTETGIVPDAIREAVFGDPALGGVATFEGVTRAESHPDHGSLVHLEYQAYGDMALDQLRHLAAEARRRWEIGRLALVHRTGSVRPGGVSVMIAVACAHRRDAFEACRWLIDTLKRDVPIWKREVWSDGSATWADPSPENATDPGDE